VITLGRRRRLLPPVHRHPQSRGHQPPTMTHPSARCCVRRHSRPVISITRGRDHVRICSLVSMVGLDQTSCVK
jgi:hypothetical protein